MPVIVEPVFLTAPRSKEIIEGELEGARVGYDLGADIIKIAFPSSDATAKLCAELDIPIVVAGGPMSGDAKSILRDISDSIEACPQAVFVSRKIRQRSPEEASVMIKEVAKITRKSYKRR
jgi:fructose-bisphosphate aldolase, class I